jgi:hypothetical protein
MRVFCPNCGTENDGQAGGTVTCSTCTTSFVVPNAQGIIAPTPPAAPAPRPVATAERPATSGWVGDTAPPLSQYAPPPQQQQSVTGAVFAPPNPRRPVQVQVTNALAVVSLIFGLFCCIPFVSPLVAIATGFAARSQIAATGGQQKGNELALAGIVLGVCSLGFWGLWLIGVVAKG